MGRKKRPKKYSNKREFRAHDGSRVVPPAFEGATELASVIGKLVEMGKQARAAADDPQVQENLRKAAEGANPERRAEAVSNLRRLLEECSKKPDPILEQFKAIGINYEIVNNVPEDTKYDTVVISMRDIENADRKLQEQGSLYFQIYGEDLVM